MSQGIITYVDEEEENYRVKNPLSNIEYSAGRITLDPIRVSDNVEIADINNERIDKNAEFDRLRFLPVRGGYPYSPSCRWYKWSELWTDGKWMSLIKEYVFYTIWQKNCPVYRLGVITKIVDNKYADVLIDKHWGMGKYERKRCRVDYMTCDTAPFVVGDEVIVKFINWDYRRPVVVGFLNNPKPCDEFLIFLMKTPEVNDDFYAFVWDPKIDDYAFVPSIANPEIPVEFPCKYSDIEVWADQFAPGKAESFTFVRSGQRTKEYQGSSYVGRGQLKNFTEDCNPLPNEWSCGVDLSAFPEGSAPWYGSGERTHSFSGANPVFNSLTDTEYVNMGRYCYTPWFIMDDRHPDPEDTPEKYNHFAFDQVVHAEASTKAVATRGVSPENSFFMPSGFMKWRNFQAEIKTEEKFEYDYTSYQESEIADDPQFDEYSDPQYAWVLDSKTKLEYICETNLGPFHHFYIDGYSFEANTNYWPDITMQEGQQSWYYPNFGGGVSSSFSFYFYMYSGYKTHTDMLGGDPWDPYRVSTFIDFDLNVQAVFFLNELDKDGNPLNPFTYPLNVRFTNAIRETLSRIFVEGHMPTFPTEFTAETTNSTILWRPLSGKLSGSRSSISSSSKSISSSSLSRSSSSRSKSSSLSKWKSKSSKSSKSSRSSTSISKSSQSIQKFSSSSESSSADSKSSRSSVSVIK